LKALLKHPLTAYISGSGHIDSIHGLEAVIHDASLKLNRNAEIASLKAALNEDMLTDLMQQSLANLPNTTMSTDAPHKFSRARMVGLTQFLDDIITQLVKVTPDTAWLMRVTYTRIASPTINFGGKRCVIDSSWGTGDQSIVYDIPHGVVISSREKFSNYLRAGIPSTDKNVIQINELTADVELIAYSSKKAAHGKSRK
jgi:hypothetical protein